jgi:hypothetical protein
MELKGYIGLKQRAPFFKKKKKKKRKKNSETGIFENVNCCTSFMAGALVT